MAVGEAAFFRQGSLIYFGKDGGGGFTLEVSGEADFGRPDAGSLAR